MNTLKVKIVTGFKESQHYTIDAEEAHKAYYLFLNPDQRGIFSNGLALIGRQIQSIEPDYVATMGWNKGYIIQPEDYGDIHEKGIDKKISKMLYDAKMIAERRSDLVSFPLDTAMEKAGLLNKPS